MNLTFLAKLFRRSAATPPATVDAKAMLLALPRPRRRWVLLKPERDPVVIPYGLATAPPIELCRSMPKRRY